MAKDIALRDKQLLEAAANHYSGDEMEAKFGIPAAEAIMVVRRLLASRDVWDEIEQRKLIMGSLYKVKERLEENLDEVLDEPKLLGEYTKLINSLDRMIDKQKTVTDDELRQISAAQSNKMLHLIELAYYRARDLLIAEYGNFIDLKMIDGAFREGMKQAHAEIVDDEDSV